MTKEKCVLFDIKTLPPLLTGPTIKYHYRYHCCNNSKHFACLSSNTFFVIGLSSLVASCIFNSLGHFNRRCEIKSIPLVISNFLSHMLNGTSL